MKIDHIMYFVRQIARVEHFTKEKNSRINNLFHMKNEASLNMATAIDHAVDNEQ